MPARTRHTVLLWGAAALWLLLVASPGLDEPCVAWFGSWGRMSWGHWWAEAAYWAGQGAVQILLTALWAVAAWMAKARYAFKVAVSALSAVAISGLATQFIKHILGRPRPNLDLPTWAFLGPSFDSDLHAFPSGHTATSFALAGVLAARYPRLAWLFFLLAAAAGVGRMLSGSHHLSDVMGGAILGLLVAAPLAVGVIKRGQGWKEPA